MRRLPSRRAISILLRGRYAYVGGKTEVARGQRLEEIAAAYSYEELMLEAGVGPVIANEIVLWLKARGAELRRSADANIQFELPAAMEISSQKAPKKMLKRPI